MNRPDPSTSPVPDAPTRSLSDRVATDLVAAIELDGAAWLEDADANARAAAETSDRRAVEIRAQDLLNGRPEAIAARRSLAAARWVGPLMLLGGAIFGLLATWAGLATGGGPSAQEVAWLNVVWFVVATLGPNLTFLLLGLAWTAWRLRRPGGGLIEWFARTMARLRRGGDDGSVQASLVAVSSLYHGRRGVLRAAAVGQLGGLAFGVAAVVALLVTFVARDHYVFFWKTTILSEQQVAGGFHAIAVPMRSVGLPAIEGGDVAAARWAPGEGLGALDQTPEAQRRWAGFLVAILLVVGVGFRMIAFGVFTAARLAIGPPRGTLSPAYAGRVVARIRKRTIDLSDADADAPDDDGDIEGTEATPDERPPGPPVMFAYEVERTRWPADGLATTLRSHPLGPPALDLGIIDGSIARDRVLDELRTAELAPLAVLAVFSRGETPARAEDRFIADLAAASGGRLVIALDLPPSLEPGAEGVDGDRIRRRTTLWREAATRAGVDRVIELDLTRLTDDQRQRVKNAVVGDPAVDSAERRPTRVFRAACDEIVRWSSRPSDDPDAALAALVKKINGMYNAPMTAASLRIPRSINEAGALARRSADRLSQILPAWMPQKPGWMSAASLTLTAGTLATVAFAGGPIGIAAGFWPVYAVAGAAFGEVMGRAAGAVAPKRPPQAGQADRVRSALLHALLLELQGMPDAEIAGALDAVLADLPNGEPRGMVDHVLMKLESREAATA